MAVYGLTGSSLSHSKSPEYFNSLFAKLNLDNTYQLFPLSKISELPELLKKNVAIKGLNVTIPFKISVAELCHELDETAIRCGSANTLVIRRNHKEIKIIGYNTDYYGFKKTAETHFPQSSKVLILGNGGVSRTVQCVLTDLILQFTVVSRRKAIQNLTYNNLKIRTLQEYQVIINTTPLGMFPDIKNKPDIPYEGICEKHLLCDMIYNPEKTEFLRKGELRGAKIVNGKEMLHLQAEKTWEIWSKDLP